MLKPELQVPAEKFPINGDELHDILASAHETVRGGPPSINLLRAAWCHVCLETGGGRACWGRNLGNIKTSSTDGWTGYWLDLTAELPAGSKEWPYQRAYSTHLSAAVDYWRLMWSRYRSACELASSSPDLMAFAAELKRLNYFEADATAYGRALEGWAPAYPGKSPSSPSSPLFPPGTFRPVYVWGLLIMSGAALAGVMWWELKA